MNQRRRICACIVAVLAIALLASANVYPRVHFADGGDYHYGWPFEWGVKYRHLEWFDDTDPRISSPVASFSAKYSHVSPGSIVLNVLCVLLGMLGAFSIGHQAFARCVFRFNTRHAMAATTIASVLFAANYYAESYIQQLAVSVAQVVSWALLFCGVNCVLNSLSGPKIQCKW